MAVVCKMLLLGCICLTILHQVQGGCKTCEFTKKDAECKDLYKPKNEHMACVPNEKTKKNLCKLYDKGYKIICMWGESIVTCLVPCPSSAAIVRYDVAIFSSFVVSVLMYIHRQ